MNVYQRALYAVLLVGAVALFAVTFWNWVDLKSTSSDLDARRREAELLRTERTRLETEIRASNARQKRLLELLEGLRGDIDAVRGEKGVLEQEITEFEKKIAELEKKNQEMAALCEERAILAKEKEDLTAKVEALTKQEAALRADLESKALDATKVQESLAALVTRMESNEAVLRENLEKLAQSNARLTEELAALNRTLDETRAELVRAEARAAEYRRQLETRSTPPEPSSDAVTGSKPKASPSGGSKVAPPAVPIEAKVRAADLDEGIVIIGAGLDEGVERGLSFWIYDGDEVVVAELRATRLQRSLTGCTVVSRGERDIRVGDVATTEPPGE